MHDANPCPDFTHAALLPTAAAPAPPPPPKNAPENSMLVENASEKE